MKADGALLTLPGGQWVGLEDARPTGTRFDGQAQYVGWYSLPSSWSTGYTRAASVTPGGGVLRATDLYPDSGVAVQRWLPSGAADTGFDEDGEAVVDFVEKHASVSTVAATADGGVLIGGYTQGADSNVARGFVMKLDAAGALDPSWAPEAEVPGVARDVGGGEVLAPTADGGVVVSCYTPRTCLQRLTGAGRLDPTFGASGTAPALAGVGDYTNLGKAWINQDHSVTVLATDTAPGDRVKALVVATYDAAGALVSDVRTPLPCSAEHYCNTYVLATEPAGQGRTWVLLQGDRSGVVLLGPGGWLDPSFANAGYADLQSLTVVGIAVDGAGRLLVAGLDGRVRHVLTDPPAPVTALTNLPSTSGTATLSWQLPQGTVGASLRHATGTSTPPTLTTGTAGPTVTGDRATFALDGRWDHVVSVFGRDSAGATGPGTSLQLRGSALQLNRTQTTTHGGSVTLAGGLHLRTGGAPVSGAAVEVLHRRKGTTAWSRLTTVTSGSIGEVRVAVKPTVTTEYHVRWSGRGNVLGSSSPALRIDVRPAVTATPSRTTAYRGTTIRVTGSVNPAHRGTVYLQRNVSGTWRNVVSSSLTSTSTYALSWRVTTPGSYSYRVLKPADGDHVAGASRTLAIRFT